MPLGERLGGLPGLLEAVRLACRSVPGKRLARLAEALQHSRAADSPPARAASRIAPAARSSASRAASREPPRRSRESRSSCWPAHPSPARPLLRLGRTRPPDLTAGGAAPGALHLLALAARQFFELAKGLVHLLLSRGRAGTLHLGVAVLEAVDLEFEQPRQVLVVGPPLATGATLRGHLDLAECRVRPLQARQGFPGGRQCRVRVRHRQQRFHPQHRRRGPRHLLEHHLVARRGVHHRATVQPPHDGLHPITDPGLGLGQRWSDAPTRSSSASRSVSRARRNSAITSSRCWADRFCSCCPPPPCWEPPERPRL